MQTLDFLRSGALAGTRRLDLNGAGLTHLPPEVYALADTLEVLNLSDNQLTHLPHDLPRLHRLKVVFCSGNPFTHLPEVLGDCPALEMVGFKACRLQHVPGASLPPGLRWLTLTDNAISHLPPELGQRPALEKLMLAGNRLTALPGSLAGAQQLALMRLSANHFTRLPGWLTELPALAWLALSGNPLGWGAQAAHKSGVPGGASHGSPAPGRAALPAVPWRDLQLGGLLGEGASGHIYRAHRVGNEQPWALKLFKGAVTSDGLPEHELAASVAAGPHPALSTPVATLADHPQGQMGMLLPLVPDGCVPLAGSPSLSSCTRDVYAPGQSFAPKATLRLLHSVVSAVAHLHARGVVHGDLYAHNILWHPDTGHALLSDMGAATVLPAGDARLSRALQAQEVLALGHLMREVLARVDGGGDVFTSSGGGDLAALAQACCTPRPTDRPAVAEVQAGLLATEF